MDSRLIKLSKTISRALRHAPWEYELELDEEGWTPVEDLLAALADWRDSWRSLTATDLAALIAGSDKRRFEIREGRIRALYGHSLPRKLLKTPAAPPAFLYHGTTQRALPSIMADGLKPMRRQYVHLSVDRATAQIVAGRKGQDVVILLIQAQRAHHEGIAFYEGNEMVWLADAIPASYLAIDAGSAGRDK